MDPMSDFGMVQFLSLRARFTAAARAWLAARKWFVRGYPVPAPPERRSKL